MTTALITGGTAGIGRAFADKFAALGYDLVLVARNQERLDEAAEELRGWSERAGAPRIRIETLSADLAAVDGRAAVEGRLGDKDRPIDILVNNAGFDLTGPFQETDIDDQERLLDVHVRAVLRFTHAALPGMIARGKGSVINVASVSAFVPRGTYSAAKAWMVTFSESLAAEFGGTGVRVMALCPGFTHTEFHDRAGIDQRQIPGWMWLDTTQVVDEAVADLRKGLPVSVPSVKYKLLVGGRKLVPRRISTRVSRGVSKRW